ncbi:enoyl-CoA hydratase-related protein [Nocardia sp. NPDC057663]|uniref:enoyl-CoA hydratase-related protein n=1 Tax=Nocardia sp. NPDC057663 TaxID=3346201 RepID=UPI00367120F7
MHMPRIGCGLAGGTWDREWPSSSVRNWRAGLIARIVSAASLIDDALSTGELIAKMSGPAAVATKDAVNRAFESSLAEGVRYERALFRARFATADKKVRYGGLSGTA